jgi:hypothetical protein
MSYSTRRLVELSCVDPVQITNSGILRKRVDVCGTAAWPSRRLKKSTKLDAGQCETLGPTTSSANSTPKDLTFEDLKVADVEITPQYSTYSRRYQNFKLTISGISPCLQTDVFPLEICILLFAFR